MNDLDLVYAALDEKGIPRDHPNVGALISKLRSKKLISLPEADIQGGLTSAYASSGKKTVRGQEFLDSLPDNKYPSVQDVKPDSTMVQAPIQRPGKNLIPIGERKHLKASEISDAEAFAQMSLEGVVPMLAGLGGSLAGASMGPAGAIIGGAGAGSAGASLQRKMMQADGAYSPEDMRALDKRLSDFRKKHPTASFIAEFIPNLLAGKPYSSGMVDAIKSGVPELVKKAAKKDVSQRLVGGGIMAGIGTTQRAMQG